jgi:Laminin B (Domain IV)/PEP-CTERM motif
MKRSLLVFLATLLVAPVFCTERSDGAVLAESTFDTDVDGWTTFTTAAGNPASNISFFAGGGNPGGGARHDAPSDNLTSFFLAPVKFETALHSAIGGSIEWDMSTISQPSDTFFTGVDIQVGAGANRIRRSLTPPAPAAHPLFTDYELGFSTADGWAFFDGTTTTPATQAQIDAILAGATSLRLRAEYFSSTTPDSSILDNVRVRGAAVPEPASLALLAAGVLIVGIARLRQR